MTAISLQFFGAVYPGNASVAPSAPRIGQIEATVGNHDPFVQGLFGSPALFARALISMFISLRAARNSINFATPSPLPP
jgi:hypothetical protein